MSAVAPDRARPRVDPACARSLDQIAAAIVLFESPGLGPAGLRRRLEAHGDPVAALARAARDDRGRRAWEDRRIRRSACRRARRFLDAGGRLAVLGDACYPPRLGGLGWAPACLYVRGGGSWPARVATLVGTRRSTPSATLFAHELAAAVAARGIGVASGMAMGIDAAAHRGALAAGGSTIAVLATGLDRCYPRVHAGLMMEIAEQGLLVSEMPPGTPPRGFQFPARNRILAALADAVVVVQAPARSGALHTATHALEAGVELLAVPGDPLLPENEGSNRLLADGARPVLGADDLIGAVIGEVQPVGPPAAPAPLPPGIERLDRRLLSHLDLTPIDLDRVARATGFSIAETLSRVARLELLGLVESSAGGQVRLTPQAARLDRWRCS